AERSGPAMATGPSTPARAAGWSVPTAGQWAASGRCAPGEVGYPTEGACSPGAGRARAERGDGEHPYASPYSVPAIPFRGRPGDAGEAGEAAPAGGGPVRGGLQGAFPDATPREG